MKGLEALKNIRAYNTEVVYDLGCEFTENPLEEECDAIEQELLKAQKQEKELETLRTGYEHIKQDLQENSELEQELGCPIPVIFKALKQQYVYTEKGKIWLLSLYHDSNGHFALFAGSNMEDALVLNSHSYMHKWFLKEDRTE